MKIRKQQKEFIDLLQGIGKLLIHLAQKKVFVMSYLNTDSLGGNTPVFIGEPDWEAQLNSNTSSVILAINDLTPEETSELKKVVVKLTTRRNSAVRGNG